ncbi:hypothetical protein ENBRE01_2568 [Enteropsectra breve]|nr:hypothetical protein ENBRE01_2568 [Enteropsectra breve]
MQIKMQMITILAIVMFACVFGAIAYAKRSKNKYREKCSSFSENPVTAESAKTVTKKIKKVTFAEQYPEGEIPQLRSKPSEESIFVVAQREIPRIVTTDKYAGNEKQERVRKFFEEHEFWMYWDKYKLRFLMTPTNHVAMNICASFLACHNEFYKQIRNSQFCAKNQPFLSLFKWIIENEQSSYDDVKKKYEELNCHFGTFEDYNDMINFVIDTVSKEDKKFQHLFRYKFSLNSSIKDESKPINKEFTLNTINVNNAAANGVLKKDIGFEEILCGSIYNSPTVSDFIHSEKNKNCKMEYSSITLGDYIIVHPARGNGKRKKLFRYPVNIGLTAMGPSSSKYQLKAIINEATQRGEEQKYKIIVFDVRQLDCLKHEEKKAKLDSLLFNPLLLLYEKSDNEDSPQSDK